jgi:hypothetical protein
LAVVKIGLAMNGMAHDLIERAWDGVLFESMGKNGRARIEECE